MPNFRGFASIRLLCYGQTLSACVPGAVDAFKSYDTSCVDHFFLPPTANIYLYLYKYYSLNLVNS